MKKIFLLTVWVLWTISSILVARTPQEAAEIASQFISERANVSASAQRVAANVQVDLAYTQYQVDQTTPALFIFNTNADNGFVLVSAEDEVRTILGYSDKGNFDKNNIPENMQFWLRMYASEIAQYEANKPVLKHGQGSVETKKRVATSYPEIAPIMSTTWGQGAPYNDQCPVVNGERSVVGCVATAISQIMYTHKYPTKGIGSKTYTTATHNKKLTVDFSSATYDWDNMLPTYTKGYTTDQANAVATLCYHVGVASEMDYSPSSSGTISQVALANMAAHFGYDKGMNILLKDFMLENDIINAIAADLQKGHPVYVGGVTKNREGHAFVCDGLNSDGYLHINWGWNGMSDGYFSISALDPDKQGTGGSSGDLAFTEGVEVFTNIQPDQGGTATALVTVDALTRTSADELSRNAQLTFSLSGFTSRGLKTAQGNVSYFIYDSNNELVQIIPCVNFELPAGYGYNDPIAISASIPSSLANGEYELEVGYVDENNTNQPILVKGKGVVRIPFTATSSQLIFGETGDGGGGEIGEVAAVSQIDVFNVDQSNVWQIDLYSNYFWGDTPYDNEVLIRFIVNSGSTTSVIGSYVLDASNSGKAGTINTEGIYAVGYYGACYQYNITDMHLTISDAGNGALKVEYYMEANGEEHTAVVTIAAPNWYLSQNDNYYYYQEYITRELASTIPASKALALTQALNHTNETEMAYYVSGIISNMRNTPEQIMQYKTARFDISDDGSTNNQLYCYNTRWLSNSNFTTGNEVNLSDEVVIYGVVQNYQGNTPEIKGYVFSHEKGKVDETTYTIENFQWENLGKTLIFSFESEAPYFHIKIFEGETEIANAVLDQKEEINVSLDYKTFTIWIRPMDATQENYAGEAVEYTVTLIDYEIYNFKTSVTGARLDASWESNAPYFQVKITKDDGTVVASQIVDFKSLYINLEVGTYTIWVCPVNAAQKYYVGEAVEATITIAEEAPDYEIYDFSVSVEGARMSASWTSNAPNFHVKLFKGEELMISQIVTYKSIYIDLEDDTYTLWVRPVDEAQEYYIGDAVEVEFEINTTPTGFDNLTVPQTVELYDMMGRLVDTKLSNDNRPFSVPNNGVYIQRIGNSTNKIYITK